MGQQFMQYTRKNCENQGYWKVLIKSETKEDYFAKIGNFGKLQRLKEQKMLFIQSIWNLEQKEICHVFIKYIPFLIDDFKIASLLESSYLKLIKNQRKIYFGQIQSKKRQGRGILISKQNKIYQGSFKNNQKCGFGTQLYPNGNIYIGEFQDNKKNGKGRFLWLNLGKPTSYDNVQNYDGQWKNGIPDGYGIHLSINGNSYKGSFKKGLKHGLGEQNYANGDHYKGQYIYGFPQGFGQYHWKDNSYYKGNFKKGLRNGYGLWQLKKNSQQIYKGHYSNDKKVGYGNYQWQNGWVYKGNFFNDLRNGYGELFDEKFQLVYKGYWQDGVQTQQNKIVKSRPYTSIKRVNKDKKFEILHKSINYNKQYVDQCKCQKKNRPFSSIAIKRYQTKQYTQRSKFNTMRTFQKSNQFQRIFDSNLYIPIKSNR